MARRLGVMGGNWSSQVINNAYAWFTTMGLPASYNTNAQHTLLMPSRTLSFKLEAVFVCTVTYQKLGEKEKPQIIG